MKIRDNHDAFAAGVLIARIHDMASDSKTIRKKASKWVVSDEIVPLSFMWCCNTLDIDGNSYRKDMLSLSIKELKDRIDEFIIMKQKQEI